MSRTWNGPQFPVFTGVHTPVCSALYRSRWTGWALPHDGQALRPAQQIKRFEVILPAPKNACPPPPPEPSNAAHHLKPVWLDAFLGSNKPTSSRLPKNRQDRVSFAGRLVTAFIPVHEGARRAGDALCSSFDSVGRHDPLASILPAISVRQRICGIP